MHRRTPLGLLAIAATGLLAACGAGNDAAELLTAPAFTEVSDAAAPSSTEQETSGSSEPQSTESPSSEEAPAGSSATDLENGDGSYRLTNQEPSNDAPRDVQASFSDMEEHGFSQVEVTVSDSDQTGFLTYVSDRSDVKITWTTWNLQGHKNTIIDRLCDVDVDVVNHNGGSVTTKRSYTGSTVTSQQCSENGTLPLGTGDESVELHLSISMPGFEPFIIKQPLRLL